MTGKAPGKPSGLPCGYGLSGIRTDPDRLRNSQSAKLTCYIAKDTAYPAKIWVSHVIYEIAEPQI